MPRFETQYKKLNPEQKKAVDTIEGPLLVIAGPGTGKTQLLSMRVANILKKADVNPGNILCLTFTDNASRNMRERLVGIIGQSAYHVSIHTFHSFGADIINQYPDYFSRRQLLQQIDELGRYELLHEIFEKLPHSNPLSAKVGDQFIFLKNTLDTISYLKQNGLTPVELHEILNANKRFIDATSKELADVFDATPSPQKLESYEMFLESIKGQLTGKRFFAFPEYAAECSVEFEASINATSASGRFAKEITAWRNKWCKKDSTGNYVWKDGGQNYRKMHAVTNIYQELLDEMGSQGLYDFDDMVIEAVHAMENNDELRYNLQERYQYILVDEFQDTNKAQLRMLVALGSNPVHENRPNIMAVGDDDQAIYAFQGAEASNMVAFSRLYDNPQLITLKNNYRSSEDIISASFQVAEQITDRLEAIIPGSHKNLAAQSKYDQSKIDHLCFVSELAQYDWIANETERLIKNGSRPEEIAIIAPRHKYLERLMPYLGNKNVPIAYERRENILDAPIIRQLLTMSELTVAISENRQNDVDALIGEVLSYDFWSIDEKLLIEVSLDCYNKHRHWLDVLIKHKDNQLRSITAWFVSLAKKSELEPMEYMLDQLVGADNVNNVSDYDEFLPNKARKNNFTSSLRQYYFSKERYENHTDAYLTLLGQLSTLRHRLRLWKPNKALYIKDLVEFARLHDAANLKIIDTNPHTQSTNAVQVMTAYKAKGLEFQTVFIINAQDEIWGPTVRSQSSRITLPKNLPIAPAGNEDNDKLRLLFVAMTRAKHTLHVTGYKNTLDNKPSPSLSFIVGDGEHAIHPTLKPKNIDKPATAKSLEILSTDWAYRFRQVIADKKSLFEPILSNYKLSVTHLNNFIDIRDAGPDYFFVHNLLRFPEALTSSAAYGDAVHKTIKWMHVALREEGKLPTINKIQTYFSDILSRKHLRKSDHKKLDKRGREALAFYLKQRPSFISATDLIERGFNNEGVTVNGAQLSGNIDQLHFINPSQVKVGDFKTGKPAKSWQGKDEFEKIKLYKYRQQLMFYKLLVENSASFQKKLTVSGGALEFIEPDENGKLLDNLELTYLDKDMERFKKLIENVWLHITELNFPDTNAYPKTYTGIKQFEEDLLGGKI